MFLFATKVLHFLQLSVYFCTDGLNVFPWLCYSLVEDGAYCLPCLLFAGKKNTAVKSFISKPFKHLPDGMGAFKRHIDPEHDVHNKYMFNYDQLISYLKGRSIDVSVNF